MCVGRLRNAALQTNDNETTRSPFPPQLLTDGVRRVCEFQTLVDTTHNCYCSIRLYETDIKNATPKRPFTASFAAPMKRLQKCVADSLPECVASLTSK